MKEVSKRPNIFVTTQNRNIRQSAANSRLSAPLKEFSPFLWLPLKLVVLSCTCFARATNLGVGCCVESD